MLSKLPIILNNKITYILFRLEKKTIDNTIVYSLYILNNETNINIIKVLGCNKINGFNYLNIQLPLNFVIIDNLAVCDYFFQINLISDFCNDIDFFKNVKDFFNKLNIKIVESGDYNLIDKILIDKLYEYRNKVDTRPLHYGVSGKDSNLHVCAESEYNVVDNNVLWYVVNDSNIDLLKPDYVDCELKDQNNFWNNINLLINISLLLLYNKTDIKKNKYKKLYKIIDKIKTHNFSINCSDLYNLDQHLSNIDNKELSIYDLEVNKDYFVNIKKKILFVKILEKNINIITISNHSVNFYNYKWYNYHPSIKNTKDNIFLNLLLNKYIYKIIIDTQYPLLKNTNNIINYYTLDHVLSKLNEYYYQNGYSQNLSTHQICLSNKTDTLPLHLGVLAKHSDSLQKSNSGTTIHVCSAESHIRNISEDLLILKKNSYDNNFFLYICDKYENDYIKILDILFQNYNFPIKFNKLELDSNFDHILYISLLKIDKSYWFRKTLFNGILPVMLLLFPLLYFIEERYFLFYLIALPLYLFLNYGLYRKKFRFSWTNKLIHIQNGVFGDKTILLKWEKIQSVKISQSLFQQRKHLADLAINTAGGTIIIPYITLEAARDLQNLALYKIEVNQTNWH